MDIDATVPVSHGKLRNERCVTVTVQVRGITVLYDLTVIFDYCGYTGSMRTVTNRMLAEREEDDKIYCSAEREIDTSLYQNV